MIMRRLIDLEKSAVAGSPPVPTRFSGENGEGDAMREIISVNQIYS